MNKPLNHEQSLWTLWIANRLEDSARRLAEVNAETQRIIAESRPSIQPMLRQALDECQADHDEQPDGACWFNNGE